MGPRHLSRALSGGLALAALALPCAGAPQNAPPASSGQARHLAAVRTERTARFFADLGAADEAARSAALALLRAAERPGQPLGARPDLAALAAAGRVLSGADAEAVRSDELARFADALDLQVVPGAFAAESEGLGTPLTVTAYRLERDPPARDVELSLDWIGPGGERRRARSEPFGAQAFRAPGFRMFVRAPLSEPGLWHLQPVVRADGREVPGAPVPVECVAGLAERVARARALAAPPGLAADAARARLDALLSSGLRAPESPVASACLAPFEDPSAPAWRAAPDGGEPFLFGGFEGQSRGGALVFLWSEGDAEELPLAGRVGDAWRALARERGLGLFVLRAVAGEGARLRAGLEEARRLAGRDPILVARGRGALVASLLFAGAAVEGQPLPLGGVVLLCPAEGLPRLMPPVPTLVVAEPPAGDPGEDPPGRSFAAGGPLAFLDEPRLPALVAEWLVP